MYLRSVADVAQLFMAVLSLDTSVLFLVRYLDVGGKSLNKWYDRFGLSAVLCDVSAIVIGFLLAHVIYPFVFSSYSLPLYLVLVVIVQMIHDLFFYVFVIQPFPTGHNQMMDVFKEYAAEKGGRILVGDAGLMLGSAAFMEVYRWLSPLGGGFLGVFTVYCLTYLLYTKRQA
jgi:uncharacterized protein YacL